jgi:hypothetical protein
MRVWSTINHANALAARQYVCGRHVLVGHVDGYGLADGWLGHVRRGLLGLAAARVPVRRRVVHHRHQPLHPYGQPRRGMRPDPSLTLAAMMMVWVRT